MQYGAGGGFRSGAGEAASVYEHGRAHGEGHGEVGQAGRAREHRQDGHADQGDGADDHADGGAQAVVTDGQHAKTGAGVVVAVHPANGVDVRVLPDKEDQEEQQSFKS